jgi:hypothetical protein
MLGRAREAFEIKCGHRSAAVTPPNDREWGYKYPHTHELPVMFVMIWNFRKKCPDLPD